MVLNKIDLIRIFFTIIVIIGAGYEAGRYTALAFFTIFLRFEIEDWLRKNNKTKI